MADLREDFVKYVVKALVNNPDEVSLARNEDEKGEFLELRVDPSDMGKVIGKAGATAKSIRILLRGVGAKDDLPPLALKIVDPERSDEDRARSHAPAAAAAATTTAVDPLTTAENADEPAEAPAAEEEKDEHQALHERTKKEMQELADFDF